MSESESSFVCEWALRFILGGPKCLSESSVVLSSGVSTKTRPLFPPLLLFGGERKVR